MIVVVGETLTDRVRRPDGTTNDHPGGGPFNTARTIGRLGQPVQLATVIGNDERGQLCLAELAESRVDTSLVQRNELPTTLALATLNAAGSASYEFDFESSAARQLSDLRLPSDTTFLHVGTLALVLEPFATAVQAAIDSLSDNVALLVDPNCRPSVVRDVPAFLGHVAAAIARADVVKLSDDDLAYLRELDGQFPDPATLIERGISCVLFTRGSSGVDVIGPWGSQTIAAPSVVVADTVGAGDSLTGAFLAWWSKNRLTRDDLSNRDCVVAATSFAVHVAALTVSVAGANPPTMAKLLAAYPAL